MKHVRYSKILASIGSLYLTTCLPTSAFAQDAADQADGGEQRESIVVTGTPIRDSLLASTEAQRRADNVVNIIASDTIGRFPDATAAGALARLPGVGVQRDQGQERYIQIRGAPTRWTQVSLDGINVLGAEDRIFRFDSVPSVQIGRLELNKTLLPSMPAEALAGRVDIKAYSPIDNPGFHFSGDFGKGFVDLGQGPVNNYSARGSWANDTLAISAAYSKFNFEQQTDNSEPRFDDVGITQLRITKYIITRQTESYSGRLQWEPTPGLRFTGTYLDTKFNDFELRNQFRFQYSRAFSGTRNFETANLVGVPMDSQFEDGVFENGVKLALLNATYEGNGWNVSADVAYTRTNFDGDIPLVTYNTSTALNAPTLANAERFPSVQLVVNAKPGGIPFSTLYDTVLSGATLARGAQQDAIDQRQFTRQQAAESSYLLGTKSWTGKVAVDRQWDSMGAEATLSFGFQFDDRKQSNTVFNQILADGVTTGTLTINTAATALGVPWTPFDFITREAWDTDFPFGYNVNYMDNPGLRKQFDAVQAAARAANAAGTGNYAVIAPDPKLFNTVAERVISGYVMNKWKWDAHTVLLGARIENTKIASTGTSTVTIPAVGSTPAQLVLTPLAFQDEFTNIFPSLHYTFDATETVKLRAALITGHARPSLEDMRATVSINDTSGTITGGNPFAIPEKAYGVDLSAEWYFAPAAILSASFYHREVSDVLFDSTSLVTDGRFDTGGTSREGYTYSSIVNGQDGHLSGVEFVYNHAWTFLPSPLDGFGVTGSLALNWGSFKTPDGSKVNFPGTSKSIISASAFYEKYGFSGRITYQTRSPWLDEVFPSGSAANSNLYWARSTRIDASARYEINKIFSVYVDVNNLTDERGVRYQGVPDRPYEVEGFGRRFLFGVRANF